MRSYYDVNALKGMYPKIISYDEWTRRELCTCKGVVSGQDRRGIATHIRATKHAGNPTITATLPLLLDLHKLRSIDSSKELPVNFKTYVHKNELKERDWQSSTRFGRSRRRRRLQGHQLQQGDKQLDGQDLDNEDHIQCAPPNWVDERPYEAQRPYYADDGTQEWLVPWMRAQWCGIYTLAIDGVWCNSFRTDTPSCVSPLLAFNPLHELAVKAWLAARFGPGVSQRYVAFQWRSETVSPRKLPSCASRLAIKTREIR